MSKIIKKLPIVLQTKPQQKFFEATFEQLFQKKQSTEEQGFIGRRVGGRFSDDDYYLSSSTLERMHYQLEPVAYTKDPVTLDERNVVFYDDFLNYIEQHKGIANNHERLFRSTRHSFAPPIDFGKFINYQNYFWVANGLPTIDVDLPKADIINYFTNNPNDDEIVVTNGSNSISLSTGMHIKPNDTTEEFIYHQKGRTVELVEIDKFVLPFDQYKPLKWDNFFEPWDSLPWDAQNIGLPYDYITIERGAIDKNGWSRTNRWYHKDVVFAVLSFLNIEPPKYKIAERPIIEFTKNIELYRSGTQFLQYVRVIVTDKLYGAIQGAPITDSLDGIVVDNNDTILIANGTQKGLYTVDTTSGTFNLIPASVTVSEGDIVISESGTIPDFNTGVGNRGKAFYYDGTNWVESAVQKKGINQAPLFNAYDYLGNPLDDETIYPNSTFAGNKIFSYKENEFSPVVDTELGFPLEYKGLGQVSDIVFENNIHIDRVFWTDVEGTDQTEVLGYYFYNDLITGQKSNCWATKINTTNSTGDQISAMSPERREFNKQYVVDQYEAIQDGVNKFKNSITSDNFVMFVNGRRVPKENLLYQDGHVLTNYQIFKGDVVEIKTYSDTVGLPSREEFGYYEIPEVLENNPQNEEVTEASLNEMSKHFISIIEEQDNLGDVSGLGLHNKYRDTARELYKGQHMLQTDSPALLAMLMSSSKNLDIIESIRHSKREYTRYRNKFVKVATQLSTENISVLPSLDEITIAKAFNEVIERIVETNEITTCFKNSYMFAFGGFVEEVFTAGNTNYVVQAIEDITKPNTQVYVYVDGVLQLVDYDYDIVNDNPIEIQFKQPATGEVRVRIYPNIESSFMPATPSKLGLYKVYKPERTIDNTYTEPFEVIIGHDGSRTPVTGIDLVDELILELEKRIYNGIDSKFRDKDYLPLLTLEDVQPSEFYNTGYKDEEISSIYKHMLSKWASTVRANITTNSTYNPLDWMTWNFTEGSWKKIYLKHYGTVRPYEAPWEMFGFSQKPDYWDTAYTGINDPLLWSDVEKGYIRGGSRQGVDIRYARPGIPPVYTLTDPLSLGITTGAVDPDKDWAVGEIGPTENGWRNTEVFPFDVCELLFLTKPAKFGYVFFDTLGTTYINDRLIDNNTLQSVKLENVSVHGETDNDGRLYKAGYQQWVTDRLEFLNLSPATEFGDLVRRLGVKLGHKLGGFTNPDTAKLYLESTSAVSVSDGLLIPSENVNIKVHDSPAIDSFTYSGVIIGITNEGKFIVSGYDMINLEFKIIPRLKTAPKKQITVGANNKPFRLYTQGNTYNINDIVKYNGVFYQAKTKIENSGRFDPSDWIKLPNLPSTGGVTVSYIKDGMDKIETIPYGTVFDTTQDVFDFLISYGDYLQSIGWVFDEVDPISNSVKNWLTSAKEFLFWVNNSWQAGSALRLSPLGKRAKIEINKGYADKITSTVNGVYNLIDENGAIIENKNVSVMRDDNTVVVEPKNTNSQIYLMRVYAYETEHRITADNKTSFEDVIFDPLFGVRQNRLEFRGLRSANWTGKKEAPGFIITSDNKLLPNFDTLAESIRRFYDTETRLDRSQIEDVARHLIGFENKDYLDNIDIIQDTQYQFYQGMIRQKGTAETISKILRSDLLSSNKSIDVFEEYAIKLGEFGNTCLIEQLDLVLKPVRLKSNPQIIELVYPASATGGIKEVIVTNASFVYRDTPIVEIVSADSGTGAEAIATLDENGKIASIVVTNPGTGYEQEPEVVIKTAAGVVTADSAVAVIQKEVTEDSLLDKIITIDFDDKDAWLTNPIRENGPKDLWQMSPAGTQKNLMPYAGFIKTDEYNASYFTIADMVGKTYNDGDYIHVSKNNENEWDVYRAHTTLSPVSVVANDGAEVTLDSSIPVSALQNVVGVFGKFYNIEYTGTGNQYIITDEEGQPLSATITSATLHLLEIRKHIDFTVLDSLPLVHEGLYWVVRDNKFGTPSWVVADYDPTGGWSLVRAEDKKVNTRLFKNAFLYDKETKDTLTMLPVYDPLKGLIPGAVEQNVDIKTYTDPAKYTNASNPALIDLAQKFGKKEVGMRWLDLNSFAYLEYEQDSLTYRRNNWGRLSNGSDPAIYEWTESVDPPASYQGKGTPKNTTDYTVVRQRNPVTGYEYNLYYFWVRSKESVEVTSNSHTMTTALLEQLLKNPKSQGYMWFSPITDKHFIVANSETILDNNEAVIQLNYKRTTKEVNDHKEWYLIAEGKEDSLVKETHWNKLVDSLCESTKGISITEMPNIGTLSGAQKIDDNTYYLVVPDPALSLFEKYGTQYRPRQNWFVDPASARKVFVQAANELLADINLLSNDIDFSSLVSTNTYWEYTLWLADGLTEDDLSPKHIVTSLTDVSGLNTNDGDIIKVEPEDEEAFYFEVGRGVVAVENAAIKLKETLYKEHRSNMLRNELREILNALNNHVFTGSYLVRKNKLFFALINYVLSEQNDVDWVFKTNYLTIKQDKIELEQKPTLENNPFDSFVEYVNEVKPYSTKLRDFKNSFSTLDVVSANVDEFDNKKIKIKFNRTTPAPVNKVRTFDGRSFIHDTYPWDIVEFGTFPWDGPLPVDYYKGTRFVESSSLPPVASATLTGNDFLQATIDNGKVRSNVTIPPSITDYSNLAVYINDEQTLNYYIVGTELYLPQSLLATDVVKLYEIEPINAQNFLQPEITAGSAEELVPLSPLEGLVLTVKTQGVTVTLPGKANGLYPIVDELFTEVRVDGVVRTDYTIEPPKPWDSFAFDDGTWDTSYYTINFNEDQTGSTIEIVYPDANYRIQRDMDNTLYRERIVDKGITLAHPIDKNSTEIVVNDASELPSATLSRPEVIWVGAERITYTVKEGNTLKGITRGTRNTSKVDHNVGDVVVYGGSTEQIPSASTFNQVGLDGAWVTEQGSKLYGLGDSIVLSGTPQGRFIRTK